MENKLATTPISPGSDESREGTRRRKRRNDLEITVRYFLPKSGSAASTPELGQEVASEGEALIQAFKNEQPFYSLAIWKAVPEVDGGRPVIVKQAVAPK